METVCDGHSVRPSGALAGAVLAKRQEVRLSGTRHRAWAKGLQLERQIVLSKRDNVLVMADIVVVEATGTRAQIASLVEPAAGPPRGLAYRKRKRATAC